MNSIYLIDPYYSDSHRYWAETLCLALDVKSRIFHKSPVHWKWRMEGAAISIAQEVIATNHVPDTFLVTDFLNLALFKSLLPEVYQKCRFVLYMHENQLTYPISETDSDRFQKRDNHYGFMNYTSCLIADQVLFNSHFHYRSFIDALNDLSKRLPDNLEINSITEKSEVLPLILDTNNFDKKFSEPKTKVKTILWNHRWEYDKRPDVFLKALIALSQTGTDFKLVLLGKINDLTIDNHSEQIQLLEQHIIHQGYASTRKEYLEIIAQCDLLVSTSIHDFFGMSVLEAIYAGCRPVLPNDLAYPELIPLSMQDDIFYDRSKLVETLRKRLAEEWSINQRTVLRTFIDSNFTWNSLKDKYHRSLGI